MRDAPFAWLRRLHPVLALAGLWWFDPSQWAIYLLVLVVLAVEWPFCIHLADDVEVYFPVAWTSAAAAYLLGPVILPIYWLAGVLGFALIVVLDARGIVPAVGIAAESAKRYRGEPYDARSIVDGDLRHVLIMSELAVRVVVFGVARRAGLGLFPGVVVAELAVIAWDRVVPIPGRMAPARWQARLASALGADLLRVTRGSDVGMVCWLLLAETYGGPLAFAAASLMTLNSHAVLKRLNDTRVELEHRQRLAVIGETASTVFHQLGRHHGSIGMYGHLLARGPADEDGAWSSTAVEHGRRILATVDEANHVVNELLAFGQDRTLNLYPHAVAELVDECIAECRARATAREVSVRAAVAPTLVARLDKHKIKQALGNVLDNAIDASPAGGIVDVETEATDGVVRIAVRDHGAGVPTRIRDRLFTPFCTTKQDGVGLGLALAKELVDAHGGALAWEPAEPGTRFVLALPREPR